MKSRRRLALAKQRESRDTQSVSVGRRVFDRDPLFESGLNSVNVEVIDAGEIRELLSAPPPGLADLHDPTSGETRFDGHDSRLSEIDSRRNDLSPTVVQPRDSVGSVVSRPEMSRTEVEAWMQRLDIDWERVLREAGIPKSQRYVVPDRWGKNTRQMTKIFLALERLEKKRSSPTEDGARILGLAEWEEIGRKLARVPELFAREIDRLRPIAAAATKIAEGDEARAALLSLTPEPKKPRK